jgi:competence protein ComEC
MLRDKQSARNARSCILRVSFAGRSVLLPGDIEANAELALVSRTSASLKADVLIAPHHGSKSSSSYALLKRVLPQLVLVPAGYKNSFGHPHEAVLARYEELDARYAATALGGMLSLEVDAGGGMAGVIEYRLAEPRYWRPRARVL